jgi:hypothetical protein
VLERNGWFYLFRNQIYGPPAQNTQYASRDPFNWRRPRPLSDRNAADCRARDVGPHGHYYIAALNPNLDGVRVAKLDWRP